MIFNSFSILDFKNKEAKTFDFNDTTNLIVSDGNHQGKSSLLKSMYYTLGFDVRQFPSGWNIDDLYFQLEIRIEDSTFTISRQKNNYRVSDRTEPMTVKEYSEWLRNRLNIYMKLPHNKTMELHDAYSTAMILPFYIDQDDSWEDTIYKNVSNATKQYRDVPKNIFESVFSLSDVEINKLISERTDYLNKKKEIQSTIENFIKIVGEYKQENETEDIVTKLDKIALKNDIDRYLHMINEFNQEVTGYKVKLLHKQELLDLQKQELSELKKLIQMNKKRYETIKTECKYCHSQLTVEQSLRRLELSNNDFEIALYKDAVQKEIQKLDQEISDFKKKQKLIEDKVDQISYEIQKSKELLTIDDYVNLKAKNEAIKTMEGLIDNQRMLKQNLDERISKLKKSIDSLKKEKNELKERIKMDYENQIIRIKNIITDIDMNELKFLDFKKISGSGTDKNKKYLAYYLVYFSLLKKYSTYKIPYCMDSFIKNEISGNSATEMFNAVQNCFFDDENQTFFSIISENLKHFKRDEVYNKILVSGHLLTKEAYDTVSLKFNF
ncbi:MULTISPECIES: hypothetical protein [Listeria]|uniref:hypothetical protein n=1 Tax=Listeria TaxID=1637 RepID=UPI000B596849|nr:MULTISPECIES: hypothetical protein [Listeria]